MAEQKLKECREAFEEWHESNRGFKPVMANGEYLMSCCEESWMLWQAAWNKRVHQQTDTDIGQPDEADRAAFEAWCITVKDVGHEVQLNSATARQRNLGWQAARAYYVPKVTQAEAAKKIMSFCFEACQPDKGNVFGWIDDNINEILVYLAAAGVRFAEKKE